VFPLSLPHRALTDTEVAGYFVKAKSTVIVNLRSAHMDPKEWPEPEVFRPERFIDQSGALFGRERVIPFSLGKRSCLGELLARQELFLLFSTLVQRFHILPPEGQDKIECGENLQATLNPAPPCEARLVPRNMRATCG